jgi:hypothetical protein
MEWTILFAGPVGAGKTQAVSTISDIEVVCTEELATDETRTLKPHTTVALDVGVMNLGAGDKVRLLGSPGQGRFDFMWDILIEQAKGLVLLIDHSREESVADLEHYLAQLRARMGSRPKPIVIGITHVDLAPHRPLAIYQAAWRTRCACSECRPPLFKVDAREAADVQRLMMVLTSMLEVAAKVPNGYAH